MLVQTSRSSLPVLRSLLVLVFGASKRLPASKFDQKRRCYSISGPQYAAHSAPHMHGMSAHGKRPRSELARKAPGSPSRKAAKRRRKPKLASPVKRTYNGKPTTSVGLASSLDRNYRECVRFEIRARYLESSVGSGKLKDGLDGDQQQLQKELDHCRLQGKLKLGKAREAERAMRRGAFAKFDIEDALLQTKRDPSACLDLPVKAKKRKEIPAVSNAGAEASSSTEQHR